jgi:hypothetical protein
LDLSYASIGLEDMVFLTEALAENVSCKTLSLKGITVLTQLHGESVHPPTWPNGIEGGDSNLPDTYKTVPRTPASNPKRE